MVFGIKKIDIRGARYEGYSSEGKTDLTLIS